MSVDIRYASIDSPFGTLHAATTERGLVRIAFPEESVEVLLERLSRKLSPRIVAAPRALAPVRRELDEYFAGRRRSFELASRLVADQSVRTARAEDDRGDPLRRRTSHTRRSLPRPAAPAALAQPATRSAPTRSRSSSPAIACCTPAAASAATAAGWTASAGCWSSRALLHARRSAGRLARASCARSPRR